MGLRKSAVVRKEEYTLTTNNDTLTTIFTLDASTADTVYRIGFDLQAVLDPNDGSAATAVYRAVAQFKNANGTVIEEQFPITVLEEAPSLVDLDFQATISGTDVLLQVKGLPADVIKWLLDVYRSSRISFTYAPPPP